MAQATKVLDRDEYGASFELDDGSQQYLLGTGAHDLADEIEASMPAPPPPVPDERMAQAAPAPDLKAGVDQVFAPYMEPAPFSGGVPDAVTGPYAGGAPEQVPMYGPPTAPPAAPPAQPKPYAEPSGVGIDEADISARVAAGEKLDLPTLPVGDDDAGADGAPPAVPYADEINAPVRVAGSPGVSQAQLAAKATQGVPIPKTQTTEISDQIPASPEITAAQADVWDREEALRNKLMEVELSTLDQRRAQANKTAADLERQAAFQRGIVKGAENKAQAAVNYLKEYDERLAAQRPDPDRFFDKRGGTWGQLAAAVFMGLGAYSAALTGGRNQVADMIENGINRETEAERDAYLRDKDARGNLVADLTRDMGDVDEAVEAAKSIRMGIVQAHAAELAASDGRRETLANFAQLKLATDQKRIDYAKNLYERSFGKAVTTTTAGVEFPKAASGGGARAPTLKERAQRAKYAGEIVEYEQKATGQAQGTEARKREEFDEKSLQALSERMEPIVKLDQANRAVTDKGVESTLSANVVPSAVAGIHPQGGKVSEQRRAWNAWMNARVHALGGAAMPPEEFERLRAGLENSLKTRESREGALKDSETVVDEQKKTILSGYPKRIRDEWIRRNKETTKEAPASAAPERKK